MLDMEEVNKRVRKLVREILAMPENSVRPANRNAPASGPKSDQFATVLITPMGGEGWDDQRFEDLPGPAKLVRETVQGLRRFSASVQFFRGDAYTKAERLSILLQASGSVSKMQAVGLGLVRVSSARDLTAVVDTFYESRGQIDIEFYLVADEKIDILTYGEFPISVSTPNSTTNFEVIEP